MTLTALAYARRATAFGALMVDHAALFVAQARPVLNSLTDAGTLQRCEHVDPTAMLDDTTAVTIIRTADPYPFEVRCAPCAGPVLRVDYGCAICRRNPAPGMQGLVSSPRDGHSTLFVGQACQDCRPAVIGR